MSEQTKKTVGLTLSLAEAAANHILRENGIEFELKFNISDAELALQVEEILEDKARLDYIEENPKMFEGVAERALGSCELSIRDIIDIARCEL